MLVNYSNQPVIVGSPSMFLVGPTPRNPKIKSWRIEEALPMLTGLGFDGIVYVPENEFDDRTFDYNDQIYWEIEALSNSDVIAAWIPRRLPDMPAFTTNVEFGEWFKSGKLLYGRPECSEKNRYLDLRYQIQTGKKPLDNLQNLLEEAIKFLFEKRTSNKN